MPPFQYSHKRRHTWVNVSNLKRFRIFPWHVRGGISDKANRIHVVHNKVWNSSFQLAHVAIDAAPGLQLVFAQEPIDEAL